MLNSPYRVIAGSSAERMAAEQAAQRKISALASAIFLDRLERILGTGRRKPTAGWLSGGEARAIKANACQKNFFHITSMINFFSTNFVPCTVRVPFPFSSSDCNNTTHFPRKQRQWGCWYGNISVGFPLSTPNSRSGPLTWKLSSLEA